MASAKSVAIQVQKLINQSNTEGFKYNTKEAATSRDWSKMMSDTSHQREVKDLIKSGLNPVLSANTGAQSYTGASAQYQAQNAGQAVASLYSSEWSAQATKKAARMSAAATRAAAAASAAATRYAADANYAAAKYQSDMNYKTQKYSIDHGKTGNMFGILDNWLTDAGIKGDVINGLTSIWKNFSGQITNKQLNQSLGWLGIPITSGNRQLMYKAATGSSKAQNKLIKKAAKYKFK